MRAARELGTGGASAPNEPQRAPEPAPRPTEPQRRYLERGLTEPGGKLPLFDRAGQSIPHKTVEACIARGWAERWFHNPIKPEWLVCKLTPAGYRVLGHEPPAAEPRSPRDR
jgi:hypothetical protein